MRKPRNYWKNKENCEKEIDAFLLKYKDKASAKLFNTENATGYKYIYKNYPELLFKFKEYRKYKPRGYWYIKSNIEQAIDDIINEYGIEVSVAKFEKRYPQAYSITLKQWPEMLDKLKIKQKFKWNECLCLGAVFTYIECKDGDKSIVDFAKEFLPVYKSILINNWTYMLDPLRLNNPKNYWTYEKCFKSVQDFLNLEDIDKTITNYANMYGTAYRTIRNNDWIYMLEPIRINKVKNYWTYEKCQIAVTEFLNSDVDINIENFRALYSGAYIAIHKNNWHNLLSNIYIYKK